ncbi:bifunctional metallophosphatase/5'-nucleotidase [Mangrovibacillus cuniculi]|uniref:Bifunctional metallophosphatase/5'-nucleotidase n=1 Tax=Mangrovibacillus cuniculi TaxID=2593652 RepID=A0A7S8HG14_9BACI|nr:bifunctional UDP-sugar hydrolase/5'-nucleotidase [Mangrovibacillus cuniculi]QPC47393.1 bifunctional metallophosphatase/5'-nucleotidase [Mangrovibacillus cuniculi]
MEKVYIYHTNDLRSHFQHWPTIQNFLLNRRKNHQEASEFALFFDIGDFADRSHPFIEGTKGTGIREMIEATYDAITIGNNEGITFTKNELNAMYENLTVPVLLNNLKDNGTLPNWASSYKIFSTNNDVRVGVIGTTAMYETFYALLGWEIEDPIQVIQQSVSELNSQCDVIVLLSHLGIHMDEQIAELDLGIDVILGGHTHHILHNGKQVKNTMLAAGGKHGQWIGEIQLEISSDRKLSSIVPRLLDVQNLPYMPGEDYELKGEKSLKKPVTIIDNDLEANWFSTSTLSTLIARSMLQHTNTSIGLFNLGTLLVPLKKGEVTSYHIHQLLPHPINYVTVEVTGSELKAIYQKCQDQSLQHFPLKGLGFRGTIMGAFHIEGMGVGSDGRTLITNGNLVRDDSIYTISTLDVFTFGPFFPEIKEAVKKRYYMPEFMRDVLEKFLTTSR